MTPSYDTTIEKRQEADKAALLGFLRKMPIVQIACERAGIARATYYRWRSEDKGFKDESDKAMRDGEQLINDLSESQVVALIKDRNLPLLALTRN